jgi:hypothetical protein
MDDSSYRLIFYLDKKDEIYPYIAKKKWCIFPSVIVKYSKFANFTGLYFPYFTTFSKFDKFWLKIQQIFGKIFGDSCAFGKHYSPS